MPLCGIIMCRCCVNCGSVVADDMFTEETQFVKGADGQVCDVTISLKLNHHLSFSTFHIDGKSKI